MIPERRRYHPASENVFYGNVFHGDELDKKFCLVAGRQGQSGAVFPDPCMEKNVNF